MIRTTAMAILLATSFIAHASEKAQAKADPAKGKVIAETVCMSPAMAPMATAQPQPIRIWLARLSNTSTNS